MLKKINFKSWKVRLLLLLVIVLGTTGALYFKKNYTYLLSPGHLSTYHKSEPLGGISSHADIEKKCSHCHAPIHCVTDTRCQDCHMEIAEQRADPTSLHGRLPGTQQCQNCHPEHRGSDAVLTSWSFQNVDHFTLSDFSLEKHKVNFDGTSFTCTTCHSQSGDRLETIDCVTCHAGEDHDYVVKHIETYGSRCFDCHDGKDRMMTDTYDHSTRFPLNGAHADQTCTDCHAQKTFQGQATTCASCHEDPKVHLGKFGLQCDRCHLDTAWTPAELRKHRFVWDHGEEVIDSCETCHAGPSYTVYTCEGCHEVAEMQSLHLAANIQTIENCATCHPTGVESEIPRKPSLNAKLTPTSPSATTMKPGSVQGATSHPTALPGLNHGSSQGGGIGPSLIPGGSDPLQVNPNPGEIIPFKPTEDVSD